MEQASETMAEKLDRPKYRQRNIIERMFGWLKENRRIVTRFDKLAPFFQVHPRSRLPGGWHGPRPCSRVTRSHKVDCPKKEQTGL